MTTLQRPRSPQVIWLPRGLTNDDDTNGHVDNFCNFVAPAQVVLSWCDDPDDPQVTRNRRAPPIALGKTPPHPGTLLSCACVHGQYAISREAWEVLTNTTDAKGRPLTVHKLPIPPVMRYTEEYCQQVPYRTVGDRLAASYVNFYIANGESSPRTPPDD
jgi:agmatine deiminase